MQLDVAVARIEEQRAKDILRWKLDLAELQHCGPNWVTTGKVGGWKEGVEFPEEVDPLIEEYERLFGVNRVG